MTTVAAKPFAVLCVLAVLVVLAPGCAKGPLDKTSQALFDAGHQSFDQGRYQDADQKFSQVIDHDPNSWALSEVYYFRGLARLHLGRRAEAKGDFQRGASLYGRELTQVYSATALANLEYEEGNDVKAVHLYRQVLDHPVKNLPVDAVLYRLAVSLQRLGRWREADETLARLISKYPDSTVAPDARRRFQATCFTVQLGAFADRRNAQALAAKLQKEGLAPALSVTSGSDGVLHRVSVGRYQTWREAAAAAEPLRQKGYTTAIRP